MQLQIFLGVLGAVLHGRGSEQAVHFGLSLAYIIVL
jgi:hypothetical protein